MTAGATVTAGSGGKPAARPERGGAARFLRAALPYAVFLAVLLLVPALFTRIPLYTMGNGVQMAILAIAALGLVPLTGYAKQISIGQAAFYGTGAYASALLTKESGLTPLVAAGIGAAIAAGAAYLIGLLLFRVEGHYLALATIGLGLVCAHAAREFEWTGRSEGIPGVESLEPFGFPLLGDVRYYYLVAGVLFVAVIAIRSGVNSRIGRSLTAVGDSPVAASASGINIAARKRLAFVVAAVLASVGGSLYAHWVSYVDPSTLDLLLSLQLLIIATVGGLRTVWGAPVGAFIIISLVQISQETLPQISDQVGGQTEIIAYGLALVLTLLLLPDGVAGTAGTWLRRLSHRRRTPTDTGPSNETGPSKVDAPTSPEATS